MNETPPDPADVHTGTDRVELTDETLDEWAARAEAATPGPWAVEFVGDIGSKSAIIECARWRGLLNTISLGEDHETAAFIAVARTAVPQLIEAVKESRARLQALTAERDNFEANCAHWMKSYEQQTEFARQMTGERDTARAELSAANARNRELEREIDERDKAHEGIVATITSAARADTRTAKSDAAKVQMLAERVDALRLSRDKHRNRAAAANTRCAELEEEVMAHQVSDGYTKGYEHGTLTTAKFKAERDAARAELAAANARCAELERERDLAIAHDTQPYPTAEAYEKVCAARTKWHEKAKALQAEIEVNDQYHDHDIETGVQFMRERDALKATLDRVTDVLDEYRTAGCCQHAESNEKQLHDLLRAALTPEEKRGSDPFTPADLGQLEQDGQAVSDHRESDLIALALRSDRKTWPCRLHPSGEPYPHVHKDGPCNEPEGKP